MEDRHLEKSNDCFAKLRYARETLKVCKAHPV